MMHPHWSVKGVMDMSGERPMTRLPGMIVPVSVVVLMLLSCVSCIPLVKESSAPPIDKYPLSGLFKNDNERILVLPVWQKYPVIISEQSIEESSTLSFGTPLFLKVKDIPGINKLISGKTTAGLIVGPLVGVGRGVFFYGYYIISESGRIIWLKNKIAKSVVISQQGKKELIKAFRESREVYSPPASDVWLFTGKLKLIINYNSSARNDIVNFISSVDDGITGPGTTVWSNGDRYEGEWVDGKKNGRGKMTLANGNWYDGEWCDDYPDGEGKARINGRIYQGIWNLGCLRDAEQQAAWGWSRHQCRLILQSTASSASTVAATTIRNRGDTIWQTPGVAGWDFTVDSALTINALGMYDSGAYEHLSSRHGLALGHNITIYDIAGPLITGASIYAGTNAPLIERTRWVQIPEVVLQPGVTYTIIADNMCISDNFGGDSCVLHDITYAAGVNLMQGLMYDKGEAFDLSARHSGDVHTTQNGFLGPNFAYLDEFTAMPAGATGTQVVAKDAAKPAGATGIPVSEMDYVLKFRGFSIQKPTDNRWQLYSDNQKPHVASFYFVPLSPTHSFNATVQLRGVPEDFATKQDFKKFVDTRLREHDSRFQKLSFTSTLTELNGEWAVTYELRYLDKNPANSTTPLFMTIKGFTYVHPYWKKSVIDAFYSERGTEAELDGTLDPVGQELIDGTSPEKS